jgi:cyclophilin family peptidyl-prolyl cis-trans isomerase
MSRRLRKSQSRSTTRTGGRSLIDGRRTRFEQLETRNMLSVTLDPTNQITSQNFSSSDGKYLYLPLNSTDTDSAATVSYSVSSNDPSLSPVVLQSNASGSIQSLDLNISGTDSSGTPFTGDIVIQLFGQYAPNTVAHIESLVQSGFYTNLDFFRVLDNFIAQAGSPTNDGQGGSSLGSIFDEYNTALTFNSPGLVAMADSGHNTDDSQFFIMDPQLASSYESQGDYSYTIIGQVTSGFTTLEDMMGTAVQNNAAGTEDSSPVSPVTINSATIITDQTNAVLQVFIPAAYTNTAALTVTATDSDGDTANASFNVTGTADTVADTPFFSPPFGSTATQSSSPFTLFPGTATPTLSTFENTTVSFSVPVTDTNSGQTPTVVLMEYDSADGEYEAATDATLSATYTPTSATTGTMAVTITPTSGFTGQAGMELQLSDGVQNNTGGADYENFVLTVNAPLTLDPTDQIANQSFTSPDGKYLYLPLNPLDQDGSASVTYQVSNSDSTLSPVVLQNSVTPTQSLDLNISGTAANGTPFSGDIIIQLFGQYAPDTVAHIVSLVDSGFYTNLDFFRVLDNFMAQAGSPTNDGQGGSSLGSIFDEYNTALTFNSPGLVAMANSGHDTDDSQFFITDTNLGTSYEAQGDYTYTIFGQVTSGFGVLQDMLGTTVQPNSSHEDSQPVSPIVINSAKIFTDSANAVLQVFIPAGYSGTDTVTVTAQDSDGNTSAVSFNVTGAADTVADLPFFSPPFASSSPTAPFTIDPTEPTIPTLAVQENSAPVSFTVPITDTNGSAGLSESLLEYNFTDGQFEAVTDATVSLSYSATTSTTGNLTVTITPNSGFIGQANLVLEIIDSGATQVDPTTGAPVPDYEQFTLDVTPGTVTQSGSTLTVNGSSTPESFLVYFDRDFSLVRVSIDGVVQNYSTSDVNNIVINGVSGADSVTVDSPPTEDATVALSSGALSFAVPNFTISSSDTPNIYYYAKVTDTAKITDPAGANTLTVTPGYEWMAGSNFNLVVIGGNQVATYSNGSGLDTAVVQAATSAQYTAYIGSSFDFGYYPNGTYHHYEYGFATVNATDTSGLVVADFYGNGSAAFQASVTGGSMSSQGFVTEASGFGRLNNYAGGAGDTIQLTTVGNSGHMQEFVAAEYAAYVDDVGVANGMASWAFGFKTVKGIGAGANTEVVFLPNVGSSNLAASTNTATMSTGSETNVATGFATATAYASSGFNTDHVAVIDFVLNKVGSWIND